MVMLLDVRRLRCYNGCPKLIIWPTVTADKFLNYFAREHTKIIQKLITITVEMREAIRFTEQR